MNGNTKGFLVVVGTANILVSAAGLKKKVGNVMTDVGKSKNENHEKLVQKNKNQNKRGFSNGTI